MRKIRKRCDKAPLLKANCPSGIARPNSGGQLWNCAQQQITGGCDDLSYPTLLVVLETLVLETLIGEQMRNHLNKYKLIKGSQHGFTKQREIIFNKCIGVR